MRQHHLRCWETDENGNPDYKKEFIWAISPSTYKKLIEMGKEHAENKDSKDLQH